MTISIQFFGAAGEVTGSCHLVTVGDQRVLLDCGLIQGGRKDEARNREPFPFNPASIGISNKQISSINTSQNEPPRFK